MKNRIAFWIWKNLSGGVEPFYQNINLRKYQSPKAPSASSWFGLKLAIWNMAAGYLVINGDLTFTPTLREKF